MGKRKIKNHIILVVLILLSVLIITNLDFMYEGINLNDSDTSKFYATVDRIYRPKNIPGSVFIDIKEYNADLLVEKEICDQFGIQWSHTLHKGDQIAFRILNDHIPLLTNDASSMFCYIVELEAEEITFFSLADYCNLLATKNFMPSIIEGYILLSVCILLIIWFVHRIRKNNKRMDSSLSEDRGYK